MDSLNNPTKIYTINIFGDISTGDETNIEIATEKVREDGVGTIFSIFSSKENMVVNFINGTVIWNKKSNSGWRYINDGIETDSLKRFLFSPGAGNIVNVQGDTFISLHQAPYLINMLDAIAKNTPLEPKLSKVRNMINKNSNFVIVKYKLK